MVNLSELRKQLDKLDDNLLKILAKRIDLIKQVAKYKLENNIKVLDSNRESEILESKINLAKQNNMSSEFIKILFTQILIESKRIQTEIIKKETKN